MGELKYRKAEEMKGSGVEWIGRIPKEWEIKPLNYFFEENKKKNKRGLEKNVLSLSYGKIVRRDVETNFGLLPASFDTYQIVENGYLIFRLTDLQNDKRSLRVGLVREKGIITSAYLALMSKNININYMYNLYHTYDVQKVYYSMGSGLRQSMAYEDMKKLPTLHPSINEQQKIANFLDIKTAQFDSIISKKELLIEKLEEAKKSLISEVVTGKVKIVDGEMVQRQPEEMKDSGVEWLGMIPKDWNTTKLKYICTTVKGYAFNSSIFRDSGHPVVRASEIKSGTITKNEIFIDKNRVNKYKKVKLFENDIIMSTVGSTPDVKNSAVGQLAKIPSEFDGALLNQNTVIFRITNKLLLINNFLFLSLIGNKFRKFLDLHAHGTANQASLTLKDVFEFPIVLPQVLDQEKIISYLEDNIDRINEIINKTKPQIQKLKEVKQSLISEAVTGKIDLRDWEIIEEGGGQ